MSSLYSFEGPQDTLHGDEEAIEACSAAFYEALSEHTTGEGGAIDAETAIVAIERTRAWLIDERKHLPDDVEKGRIDAERTIKDRDSQLSYINPDRFS